MISDKLPPNDDTGSASDGVQIRLRVELLQRLKATQSTDSAMNELHAKLAVATEIFEGHGDAGRLGVQQSIFAVAEYFVSQGIPYAALAPLSAVLEAIRDAERGRESPIFKKARKPRGGKAPTATGRLIFEGYLATVAGCCVLHCKKQKKWPFRAEAARLAKKLIEESSWPEKPGIDQLINLLERVPHAEKLSPDRVTFDLFMKQKMAQERPLEFAKALLLSPRVNLPPKVNFLSNPPLSEE